MTSLRVFEAAARLGSFKKAAEELAVTPAAVSHQITQLEDYLGLQLFERLHRGIALTPAAKASAEHLTDGFDAIRRAVETFGSPLRGPVTISCPPSFAHRWLLPRLHRFATLHPDIDVQVTTQLDVVRASQRGRPDAASRTLDLVDVYDVVVGFGEASSYPLPVVPLLPLSITPLCSPDLLAGIDTSDANVIGMLPLLHDGRGPLYQNEEYWAVWLAAAGLDPAISRQGVHFTHSFLALDAAVAGRGIVASTPALAELDIAAGRLVAPFSLSIPLPQAYHLAISKGRAPGTSEQHFIDWLLRVAGEKSAVAG